ncbi:dUTP diphosphatase [Porticoccaceae bacterium LTM1]|nr:dUTP diphosphatase [Porticoccaceae bacterium LTM1]
MRQQLLTMLQLQDGMNSKVNSDWKSRNHEWYRAIWVECGELMDHYGWKWWKHQAPDVDQVKLELVDIWHFGLSTLLQHDQSKEQMAQQLEQGLLESVQVGEFREDLEAFTLCTLETKAFDITGFTRLMAGVEMDFEELYVRYVGKNVLNFFRQDHGYKDGTYIKIWHGKEDNEHLVEVVAELDHSSKSFSDDLYDALKERYPV